MASAVSGILSKTAETKPSPSVVSQLGDGKDLTGIIDAAETSAMRKIAPRAASGNDRPIGPRDWDGQQNCRRDRKSY